MSTHPDPGRYVEGDSFAARCPQCNSPVLIEVSVDRWPRWVDTALGMAVLFVISLCLLYIVHLDTRVVEITRERDNLMHQLAGDYP